MRRESSPGNKSQDELAEALRELEERQRARERKPPREREGARQESRERRRAADRTAQEDVQEAVEQILEERAVAERRPRAKAGVGPAVRWIFLGVVAGLMVAAVVTLRPTPLPPPAASPQEAVKGFWEAVIAGNYEGATVYYPTLVDQYGSRKQAALRLRQYFGDNPPVSIPAIGEPEALPDSNDVRVSYEVILRSARPRRGECIVRYSGEELGYVIVAGP